MEEGTIERQTCHEEEDEYENGRVREVENRRNCARNGEFGVEEVNAVQEQIDRCEARCEETAPPPEMGRMKEVSRGREGRHKPSVVLGTQMEVGQQNGCLRTGNDENDEHQKQESEHVVGLMGPAKR